MEEWATRTPHPVLFNSEQKSVIALIVGQIEAVVETREARERGEDVEDPEQMVMLLHGQGGSGKTEVVGLIRRLCRDVFGVGSEMAVASSNSAARNVGGETIHSAFKLGSFQSLAVKDLAKRKVDDEAIDRLSSVECVIVEEVSMVESALLGAASYRMCAARERKNLCQSSLYMVRGHLFGAAPIVLFLGDFYQLGPVCRGGKRSSLLSRADSREPEHVRNGQAIFLDGINHVMFFYETHRFVDRFVSPPRPCAFMPSFLQAMRNGDKLTDEQWRVVQGWQVKRGDRRFEQEHIREGFEMGIAWEAVGRQMQYRAIREARERKAMLLYVQAVDVCKHSIPASEYKKMFEKVSMTTTGNLLGMCPLFVGMRVRLTQKLSGRHRIVQDATGTVVGVKFHPHEFQSMTSDWRNNSEHPAHGRGFYRLRFAPRCAFVKFDGFEEDIGHGVGIVQVSNMKSSWQFTAHAIDENDVRHKVTRSVVRYQLPLAPERVRTVQTAQGLGMDAATMTLEKAGSMSMDDWWLHLYVMLSRVRVSHRLLVYSLPPKHVFERGPPAFVKDGVERLERMVPRSRDIVRTTAKEYGWDVGPEVAPPAPADARAPESDADSTAVRVRELPSAGVADVGATLPLGRVASPPRQSSQQPQSSVRPQRKHARLSFAAPPAVVRSRRGGLPDEDPPPDPEPPIHVPPGAVRSSRAEFAEYPGIVPELGVPAELRQAPPDEDLCVAAYQVPVDDLLHGLQWHPAGGHQSLRGIRNIGSSCFAAAACQVLLRLLPVRRILSSHLERCAFKDDADPSVSCSLCALALQAEALNYRINF